MSLTIVGMLSSARGVRGPQRATATPLVPVDDRSQPRGQHTLEPLRLVDHRQAWALLNKQQERVAGVRRSDADPLPALAELHGLADRVPRRLLQVGLAHQQRPGRAHPGIRVAIAISRR